jgi:hypothetical protein
MNLAMHIRCVAGDRIGSRTFGLKQGFWERVGGDLMVERVSRQRRPLSTADQAR